MVIGITGATGRLGRLVVEALQANAPDRALVAFSRSADRAAALGVEGRRFDYDQPQTLAPALAGIDRLLLVSSNDLAPGAMIRQHRAVIEAALEAGVGLVAYTSLLNADRWPLSFAQAHKATEDALRASGLPWVMLRNGWRAENYQPMMDGLLADGILHSSSRGGRVAWASCRDYADAAAAVLIGEGHQGQVYELAGDVAHTLAELAEEIARQSGRPIRYEPVSEAEHIRILRQAGLPETWVMMTALPEAHAVARGLLESAAPALSGLIGRPTTTLAEAVSAALAARPGPHVDR